MLVIRLAPCGRKHSPKYRIVVADSRYPVRGRFIEKLGNFESAESRFSINGERLELWKKQGAQMSLRVKSLLRKHQENGK